MDADPGGFHDLADLATAHGSRRAWSIEGTGGYGAPCTVLARGDRADHRARPSAPRRGGAKSDSIDAIRAAREALGRTELVEPKIRGERAALAALLGGLALGSGLGNRRPAPTARSHRVSARGAATVLPRLVDRPHPPAGRSSPDRRAMGRRDEDHGTSTSLIGTPGGNARRRSEGARARDRRARAVLASRPPRPAWRGPNRRCDGAVRVVSSTLVLK